ncbi:hypothetical protein [Kitasatospora sp. GP82]|uniref:hypothetical protein n=1 Tax=Kitasatospora sp. GP82 TaxID=3035089 RepID=UPI0024735A4B|nr:hypothetical protein [Kitasatospora sp. GP82]MDH6124248.1 hypothetical protein [Kitasatospora sp. GP82]
MSSTTPAAKPTPHRRVPDDCPAEDGPAVPMRTLLAACAAAAAVSTPPKPEADAKSAKPPAHTPKAA